MQTGLCYLQSILEILWILKYLSPGCLSSQAKFSCCGNKSLAAQQAFHINRRNLFHDMVAHDWPEVHLLLWSLCLESIFYSQCTHLIEASHQTKPISC